MALVGLEPVEIDADARSSSSLAGFVITLRGLDVQRSAIDGQQPAVVAEFIALGVAAEIVVIVEDQHARAAPGAFQEIVGRAQAADAAADDHQVIGLVEARGGRQIHATAVAQLMRHFERSGMVAAHSGQRRRIIIGGLLGSEFLRLAQWGSSMAPAAARSRR